MATLALGVVDELRLIVHPALVRSGTRLFDGDFPAQPLLRTGLDQFASGVVVLRYALSASAQQ